MSGGSLKVKIFDSNGTQVVPVAKTNLTVGSAKHCDVVLDHPSVQPEHLRAWFDAGRIWIQDMGSQSGTYLNGIRLPSLKPMLIRELDVLRLGDNPGTLGMEANLVRAPVVRPQVLAVDEVTQPGVKASPAKDVELEKKRDELAKIRRELAELKLQLQMGRLDKESEDEAHRHLSMIRNEMQTLQDQKAKLERAMKQMDSQRQSQLDALEKELTERKNASMTQLKNIMDHEMSKLAAWKMQVIGDIRRDIHTISQAKARAWITRPLSQDMILEWESDIQNLMRRVLLGEKIETESAPAEHATPVPSAAPPIPDSISRSQKTRDAEREPMRDRRERDDSTQSSFRLSGSLPTRTQSVDSDFTRTGISANTSHGNTPVPKMKSRVQMGRGAETIKLVFVIVLLGGLIAAAVLFKKGLFPLRERGLASGPSETSGSSVKSSTATGPSMGGKKRYEPIQTKGFRKSYTDNILFTPEFLDLETSASYRNQWLGEFSKTATTEWKLDSNTAKLVMEREGNLLTDLKRLRENIDGVAEQPGIQAMREREAAFQMELNTLLKGKPLTEKFVKLKKSFFTRLQLGMKPSKK